MSILRRLFGLESKKTEEPTLDLAARQEKINESPAIAAAAEAPTAPAPAPADVVVEAQGQAPAELIATPAEPVVVAATAVPVATRARKTAASKAPRAKKIKK
jgi:hypothetical protein